MRSSSIMADSQLPTANTIYKNTAGEISPIDSLFQHISSDKINMTCLHVTDERSPL